jgi:hypothetical protein
MFTIAGYVFPPPLFLPISLITHCLLLPFSAFLGIIGIFVPGGLGLHTLFIEYPLTSLIVFYMQLYAINHGVNQQLAFYTITILNGASVVRINRPVDFQTPDPFDVHSLVGLSLV